MKGINKYLFLDVDGVLNSVSWYREEWNKDHSYPQGDFDPKCVEIVNRIVEETGCKVVVSSSWRTESNLQSIFDKAGLKFKIHSITPFGSHRGCEIQEWLDSQTEPYVYAILDDDRDMLSHQRKYFIKTNTVIGITDEAEILEELLPKEPTKEELNAALLKLALDKGWYDDNEEHNIHPVQIPKNQMGIAAKELKAKYPAADGKKIADLVKANLCN